MVFACGAESDVAYIHCLVPGHLQVDEKKLQNIAGAPCRLLDSEELLRVTGAVVGGVHPFIPNVSRRLVDKRILKSQQVSFNTGDMSVGLVLRTSDFVLALQEQQTLCDLAIAESGEEAEELACRLGVPAPAARFLLENDLTDYFQACASGLEGAERDAPVEAIIDWLRALVRFAGQAGVEQPAGVVEGNWLGQLARKTGATKFAREEALKQYLASGQVRGAEQACGR
jgi:hypothetical protein